MNIKPLNPNFLMPTRGSEMAGAFDLYMPEDGEIHHTVKTVGLGFAAEVPKGFVALLLPRSGVGAKHGLELNNTCGVIDSDYRGEWKAVLRTKSTADYAWKAGDRLLQMLIVPVADISLNEVEELSDTERGQGGFGSSGTGVIQPTNPLLAIGLTPWCNAYSLIS